MSSEKAIDGCLQSVRSGTGGSTSRLLQVLCDEIVFTPVITVKSLDDEQGTNKVSVASFKRKGRTVVPIFTSEERFLEWSSSKYQCFSVAAADLALTLPHDAWVMVNPGHLFSCQLSPSDVKRMSQIDPSTVQTQTSFPAVDEGLESLEEASETDTLAVSRDELFAKLNDQALHGSNSPAEIFEEVTADLRQILLNYEEVQEAYFQEVDSDHTYAVVGLLTRLVTAERRFLLIDAIAEVSRKFYNMAGAIEVYDDLDNTTSASWDLFKAIAPFYTRDESAGIRASDPAALNSGISVKHAESGLYDGSEIDRSQRGGTWDSLRDKSSKLFARIFPDES